MERCTTNRLPNRLLTRSVENVEVIHVEGNHGLLTHSQSRARIHTGDERVRSADQVQEDFVAHQLGYIHAHIDFLRVGIGGDELGIVERTVKVHRKAIMTKLGVRSVAALIQLAQEAGVPMPPAASFP